MATYRVDLEYEGTRYRGWQEQRNARSITGELRRAMVAAGAQIVDIGGAGRTDAGVHAVAQTAHVRLVRAVEPGGFRLAVNEALPPDIHVLDVRRAHDRFHARHDAIARVYLYQIATRRTATAKRFVWWVKRPVDPARMASAVRALEGRHDFRWFCEQPSAQPSTIVVVDRAEVASEGALVLVRLIASHFIWKMVRRVVGAVVRVGAGELSEDAFRRLLEPRPEASAPGLARFTAPPSGLFLERVVYPGEPPVGVPVPVVPVRAWAPESAPFLGRGGNPRVSRRR